MGLEENFDKRVSESPVIKDLKKGQEDIQKTLNDEIKSNNERFGNLEDKVSDLERKVDNGFKTLGAKIDNLAEVVTTNKTQTLENKLENAEKALDRKNSNGDKVKNGSIITLLGTVAYFTFDKFGMILAG